MMLRPLNLPARQRPNARGHGPPKTHAPPSPASARSRHHHPTPLLPRRLPPPPHALTPDASPTWTLDQIAGLVFGVSSGHMWAEPSILLLSPFSLICSSHRPRPFPSLTSPVSPLSSLPPSIQAGLLASVLLAYRVDVAIARGQRAELGLCERCGGVNEAASCTDAACPARR